MMAFYVSSKPSAKLIVEGRMTGPRERLFTRPRLQAAIAAYTGMLTWKWSTQNANGRFDDLLVSMTGGSPELDGEDDVIFERVRQARALQAQNRALGRAEAELDKIQKSEQDEVLKQGLLNRIKA